MSTAYAPIQSCSKGGRREGGSVWAGEHMFPDAGMRGPAAILVISVGLYPLHIRGIRCI